MTSSSVGRAWRARPNLVIAMALAAHLAACSGDRPSDPDDDGAPEVFAPQGLTVSEPVQTDGGLAGPGDVYVSASPGSFADGVEATVTNLASGESVTTAVIDGGFDPIAIEGAPGDELEIVVRNQDGSITVARAPVPARKRPKVVRTRPPHRDTDIVLNTSAAAVFSEPVDRSTITSETVKLLLDGVAVDGTLAPRADGLFVQFTPAQFLAPNTEYTLVITTGVRDLQGDRLEEETAASFTTETPPAATLVFALQPTVAHGNQPMAWVEVAIQDLFGNIIESSTNLVTLALDSNPVGGTLLGTTTVRAVEGIATFKDLRVDRPASGYTLVAAAEDLASATSSEFDIIVDFVSVSAGSVHTCGLAATGDAYCWGSNTNGRLGDGTTIGNLTPVLVSGGLEFASVTAGWSHTCGLSPAGDAFCWGENFFGQLGDGSTTSRASPVSVSGRLPFASIGAGDHTCALSGAGDAYCWGDNFYGQLGDGTTAASPVPVLVSGGRNFASVSVGGHYSCGLADLGLIYCWGDNHFGQLGDGTGTPSPTPVSIAGTNAFASVSSGVFHSCGVTTAGDAYCWGMNSAGRLGDGTGNGSLTPVPVAGGLTFTSLSAGDQHTCGVATGADAYCWGWNRSGALGDGSTVNRLAPVPVSGGLSFASVSAGGHTCGITPEGDVYCWGSNTDGQLGDGTVNRRLVPTRVVQ